ncbi:MAG: DUF3987 domain-containing protein [Synechococcaceae cyanobacterium]|nr:DUF3987 domain-containing protein [Synechococcaceae cyanobacterium]
MTASAIKAPWQQAGAEAEHFLKLLGKNPLHTYFRTIRPKVGANLNREGADLNGFHATDLAIDNDGGESVYAVIGNATGATGTRTIKKNGKEVKKPTGAVCDRDCPTVSAFFIEWDGKPKEWQVTAWRELGLPEPTVMVDTGGKSIHCYWITTEPLDAAIWKPLQARLIAHCDSDPQCKNPARVMRLPGFRYVDKATGKVTDRRAAIIHESGHRYTVADIEACLPPLLPPEVPTSPPKLATTHPATDLPPRDLEAIREAATFIPVRVGDNGTYISDRNALCGCAAALAQIGHPEEMALDLLASKWPDRKTAEQVLRSTTTRDPASFWAIAKEHGYNLTRTDLKAPPHRPRKEQPSQPPAPQPQRPSLADLKQRLSEAIAAGSGGVELAQLMAELAELANQPLITVQRLADAIRTEQQQAADVAAEAAALVAAADRKELGQLLTPSALLPLPIATAIETRTQFLPCDGPSAVLPFLAAVAGLVKLGTEVEGCAVAAYRVPVNLFACLVGRSGAKKSPLGRLLVEAPIQPLRVEIARSNKTAEQDWKEACRGVKRDEQPDPPQPRHLRVMEATGEALAVALQTQEEAGLGLLIHRDELSGLFGGLNQYRGGRGADEQQLLELFDGGGMSSLRVTGSRFYNRSQVSIYGTTQPDVLRQLVADGDASGLWARFLFVPLPERAVALPLATTPEAIAAVEAAAQTLADVVGVIYRLPPRTYRLSPEAAHRFALFELSRQRAALGTAISAQSALYGKSAGKVLRVAGVLHLLKIATEEAQPDDRISATTIDNAAALVEHLDGWALSLHAEVATGGVGQLMRIVHSTAEAAEDAIRWKEVLMRLSKAQRKEIDSGAVAEAMRALASSGWGEIEVGKRGGLCYRAIKPLP